jgi:hypothetical protein
LEPSAKVHFSRHSFKVTKIASQFQSKKSRRSFKVTKIASQFQSNTNCVAVSSLYISIEISQNIVKASPFETPDPPMFFSVEDFQKNDCLNVAFLIQFFVNFRFVFSEQDGAKMNQLEIRITWTMALICFCYVILVKAFLILKSEL